MTREILFFIEKVGTCDLVHLLLMPIRCIAMRNQEQAQDSKRNKRDRGYFQLLWSVWWSCCKENFGAAVTNRRTKNNRQKKTVTFKNIAKAQSIDFIALEYCVLL